jgi:hypothetical protein
MNYLDIRESYHSSLNTEISTILKYYSYIMTEYIFNINQKIHTMEQNKRIFIIIRGLDTITHIFLYILYYTQNITIITQIVEKSILSYIEFIEQMDYYKNSPLEWNSRDAVQYLYKKTIYDLKGKYRQPIVFSQMNDLEHSIRSINQQIKHDMHHKINKSKILLANELNDITIYELKKIN